MILYIDSWNLLLIWYSLIFLLDICLWFSFLLQKIILRIISFGLFSSFITLDLITFGYSTLVWFYIFTKKKSILLNFVEFCSNFIIVSKSIVNCFSFFCWIYNKPLYILIEIQIFVSFYFGSQVDNMFQQLENRKKIVQQNCLIITSNSQIIPAMIFRQLSGLSRYIQSYYLESSFQIYLDIETEFNPQLTQILDVQLPAWNDSLVEYILHLFTSQIIWDRTLNHAIYTTYLLLTHLAYLFEEGISLTHELDASKLYHNIGYAARRESLFFAPYNKGSLL